MHISDWSADVCSSDLLVRADKGQSCTARLVDIPIIGETRRAEAANRNILEIAGADELLDLGIRWRRGAVSHCIRIATFLDSEELVGVRDLRAFSNEASGFRIRLRSEKALTQKQRSRQRQTDEQNNANNADEHVAHKNSPKKSRLTPLGPNLPR